jgi:hypothetical protein
MSNSPSWPEVLLSLATILAIIVGPILAIQVDKILQARRDKRDDKEHVFNELMLTRGQRVSQRHSEALNGVLVEFSEKIPKEKPVIEAWQLYLNHLNQIVSPADYNVWQSRSDSLFVDLIYEMAKSLGRDFPKARIQKDWYVPRYLGELENDNNQLRKALVAVFSGEKRLQIDSHVTPEEFALMMRAIYARPAEKPKTEE